MASSFLFPSVCSYDAPLSAFLSPEAALLLVSTKNRDLWPSPTPEVRGFTDFPSLCACSESSLTNLIGCGLNLLCLQSHSKTECRWTRPEVAILGADQKERGLWGRECSSAPKTFLNVLLPSVVNLYPHFLFIYNPFLVWFGKTFAKSFDSLRGTTRIGIYTYCKGGKFLKKLWCYVGGSITR